MAEKIKRICSTCKKKFEILKSRLRWGGTFCSQKCQRNRGVNKITKTCVTCGKVYEIRPCEERYRAPTCSNECTKKYSRDKYNKKVICPICKKEFWTPKKNPLKHCSIKCRNESYIGKNMTGKVHICPICKKEFYVRRGRLKRGGGIYCSRRCRDNVPKMTIEERIKGGGLVELECEWCRKKFIKSKFFKNIQRYCSHECAKKSKNETIIETKTRKELERRGIYFEQEKSIKSEKKKYFIDFFLPPNVIIECNGDFWHNPKFFPEVYKKDLIKEKYLKNKGYKVYFLNENEINQKIKKLIDNILKDNPRVKIGLKINPKLKQRKRTLIIKICKFCEKEFRTIPSRAEQQNFCNCKCRYNFYSIKMRCKNCKKFFIIRRYHKNKKFCSTFCSANCRKEFTKKMNARNCNNCSNTFSPNPADVKRGKAKFCSKKCVLEYKKKQKLGIQS